MSITEQEVRRIVREEIKQVLESLAVEADRADTPYETGELASAGLQAVAEAATLTVKAMDHASDCGLRERGRTNRCTCHVEADSWENRWIRRRTAEQEGRS